MGKMPLPLRPCKHAHVWSSALSRNKTSSEPRWITLTREHRINRRFLSHMFAWCLNHFLAGFSSTCVHASEDVRACVRSCVTFERTTTNHKLLNATDGNGSHWILIYMVHTFFSATPSAPFVFRFHCCLCAKGKPWRGS